jgi:DNA polymerase III delta prime subunit
MSKDEAIPHIIFYGPEGSGKKTMIRLFLEMLFDSSVHRTVDVAYKVSGSTSKNKVEKIKQSNYHIVINPKNNNYDRYLIHDIVKEYAKRKSLGAYKTDRSFKVVSINNLDNKNSDVLEPTSVLFMKPIDIQRNQLIMYDNWDSNSSFQYKISQKDTINQINIRITNQDNEPISTLGDWQLTMQLERHDEDITESLLTQIKEYISYLFLIIGTYLS